MSDDKERTHFGFTEVDVDAKEQLVGSVFHRVAKSYDLMNDLMVSEPVGRLVRLTFKWLHKFPRHSQEAFTGCGRTHLFKQQVH